MLNVAVRYAGVVVTDLVQIQRLGEKKRPENERLRKHMKRHNFPDRRLRKLAEDVEAQFDCSACANCCRVATARITERDVLKVAKFIGVTPARFLADYTTQTEDEGLVLRRTDTGCVFLEGNLCTVYEARPHTCQDFPHTVRGDGSFVSRMWDFKDRAVYCPIVYNTLEAVKDEVGFQR
ncbi:MAG: YkgJ family cysteine cluster protein [Bryobacteraceae bacterium]|nr:YkgJ family cysteine cluster protein [Bryobacteraceae bacterium]